MIYATRRIRTITHVILDFPFFAKGPSPAFSPLLTSTSVRLPRLLAAHNPVSLSQANIPD